MAILAQLDRNDINTVALDCGCQSLIHCMFHCMFVNSLLYRNLGMDVKFIPLNDLDALNALNRAVSREQTLELYGLEVEHGALRVVGHRTGRFFAASGIGLTGNYYTLAKSLGAGVAKISAVMFRASLYQHDFALHHSSTFPEDDLSCRAARTALEILEQDGGATSR